MKILPLKKRGGGGGVFEKGCLIEDLWYKLKCMEWASLEA